MGDSLLKAESYAKLAHSFQAENITLIDLRNVSSIADYFLICTANSIPHLKSLTRDFKDEFSNINQPVNNITGNINSKWVIIDLFDIVIHIFDDEKRDFYSLEDLWSDANKIELNLSD